MRFKPISKKLSIRFTLWKLGGCLLLLCLISLHACKLNLSSDTPLPDPEPTLPPATQTGANTFGCMLNGEVWVAGEERCNGPFSPTAWIGFFNSKIALDINACAKIVDEEGTQITVQNFSLGISDFNNEGIYHFGENAEIFFTDRLTDCRYLSNDNDSLNPFIDGHIEITKLDSQSRIVAGTFEFKIANNICDTIRITDGRFDIRY